MLDDAVCAGMLAEKLIAAAALQGDVPSLSDSCQIALALWRNGKDDLKAGIMQSQRPLARHQIHVVVRAWQWEPLAKEQTSRHPKVQYQQPLAGIGQQVFAPSPQIHHVLAHQQLRITPQRPAKGFSHNDRFDTSAFDGVCKTAARCFYFGQLRHTGVHAMGYRAWIIMVAWCYSTAFELPL